METSTQSGDVDLNVDSTAALLMERRTQAVEEEAPPEQNAQVEGEEQEQQEQQEAAEREPEVEDAIEEEAETFKHVSELAEASGVDLEDFLSNINLTTKVNGVESEVSLADLRKGYQLTSDYTKKNQAFIEEQKAFNEQQVQDQAILKSEMEKAGSVLAMAQQQLTQDYNGINWEQLKVDNPSEFLIKRQAFGERQASINIAIEQGTQQANQLMSQQNQAKQESDAKYLTEQNSLLLSAIPEWKDEAVRNSGAKDVGEFLGTLGFQPEEIAGIKDHRYILLAKQAMAGNKEASEITLAKKKLKKAPKLVAPGARQSASAARSKSTQDAINKAKKTGKTADIAAALLAKRSK